VINFSKLDLILKNSKYQRLIITGHTNVDFDSVGSMVSFADIVHNHYKKTCDLVIEGETIAENMQYALNGFIGKIVNGTEDAKTNISENYDLLVVLDCSDSHRVPEGLNSLVEKLDILVIDHHYSTNDFGTYRFINSEVPATGMIVYELAKYLKYPIKKHFADAVMVSIYGDTGSFGNANTTAKVFEVASEMCKQGSNPNEIYRSMFYNSSIKKMKISSVVYDSVRQFANGKITLILVDEKTMVNLGANKSDIDGFAGDTLKVSGTKIGVYAKISKDTIKFSFRSLPNIDVRSVAKIFGGGGHKVAAGCKIADTNFEKVWNDILEELKKIV